ncbi:MAG: hypothetical protein KJS97_01320 [Alphaproteobacteria bacterium]|nr:hypothetical protein [Alphaproteobacteria bacterium]
MAASPLAVLFDKRARALSTARFKAWWDGKTFDQAAFDAEMEAAAAAAANDAAGAPAKPGGSGDPASAGDADLFDPEPDPRLTALQLVWGDARLTPGDDTMEELAAARLATPDDGLFGVSGVGLAAPVLAVASGFAGQLAVFEWRAETRAALTARLKAAGLAERAPVKAFDLETGHFGDDTLDGLLSVDDFTFCENPARFAVQIARALKAGRGAVIEAYAATPGPDLAPAFASAFAEPQLHTAAKIGELLFEAGLRIEEEEDLTELHIEWARAGFQRLKAGLDGVSLKPRGLQELAWEMETWRARLRLLDARRMERRAWRVIRR